MSEPEVTFTGKEVAYVVGAISTILRDGDHLNANDRQILTGMNDRALAAIRDQIDDDTLGVIEEIQREAGA